MFLSFSYSFYIKNDEKYYKDHFELSRQNISFSKVDGIDIKFVITSETTLEIKIISNSMTIPIIRISDKKYPDIEIVKMLLMDAYSIGIPIEMDGLFNFSNNHNKYIYEIYSLGKIY